MSTSAVSSVAGWVQDVVRTKRLSPPNPILESLPSSTGDGGLPPTLSEPNVSKLLKFSILKPHHLAKAAGEVSRRRDAELARLEARWTAADADDSATPPSLCSLLMDLDRLAAPTAQLREVSDLCKTLASPPGEVDDWIEASEGVDSAARELSEGLHRSGVVYRALASAVARSGDGAEPPSFLVPFLERGAHLDAQEGEGLRQIQEELAILHDQLDVAAGHDRTTKAMRLQIISDMYNCVGLSRLQAESLPSPSGAKHSVWDLARLRHGHMVTSPQKQLMESLFPELQSFLQPHLPKKAKLDFIGGNSGGVTDAEKETLAAERRFRECVRMHGVLEVLTDFCDKVLGIVIVEDTEANSAEAGWNINVRLFHIYERAAAANGEDGPRGAYLGAIYLDPFADQYTRSEEAWRLVDARPFGQQVTGQTAAPAAVVALAIAPIWDDASVPVTWKDARDLLYQFGKAIQLVLDQSRRKRSYPANDPRAVEPSPIDCSEFLAHFLELQLQDDGFLHRLARRSQDESVLDDQTIRSLRGGLRSEKALELAHAMFLSALQHAVFEEFDPRGDETLAALQERLAARYLPGSQRPEPGDPSPLLVVFQQHGIDQNMSAYGALWSEALACAVYEAFQKTDPRDGEEAKRLGTGVRDLFLRGGERNDDGTNGPLTRADFAELCGVEEDSIGSGAPLARVYGFDSDPAVSADRKGDENE